MKLTVLKFYPENWDAPPRRKLVRYCGGFFPSKGGFPPPLHHFDPRKNAPTRAKNGVFALDNVRIYQIRLKMDRKRLKGFRPKIPGFFWRNWGVTPSPPLRKTFGGNGGYQMRQICSKIPPSKRKHKKHSSRGQKRVCYIT